MLLQTTLVLYTKHVQEWPVYVNYTKIMKQMAIDTANAIKTAASSYLHEEFIQQHLNEQQKF